jgi:hypothetical protein
MSHVAGLILMVSALLLSATTTVDAQRDRTSTRSRDVFANVRCGTDIVKALLGGTLPDRRVVAIEAAHADINLKHTGGTIITDSTFLGGWRMCGENYEILTAESRVIDAIRFPPHSRRQPGFLGSCTVQQQTIPSVLAVLDNPTPRAANQPPYQPNDTTSLAAIAAWSIDEKGRRLLPIATTGLRCPRGGIFTVDGGL